MKNNNAALPKLTADIFNRPDCPKWAKVAPEYCGVIEEVKE